MNEARWGVLYCPRRSYHSKKRWGRIERCLRDNGIDFDFVQSENVDSVERLFKMLMSNGYRTIIIVGGDSAMNDAVNCMMRVDKVTRDDISLGLIPNGLMNDFARFWGVRENDVEHNVESLKARHIRRIDVGRVTYKDGRGETCHHYFLNCVNVGLVSAIMALRLKTLHLFGSRVLSFIFSFVLLFFQRLEYKMHIKVDTDLIKRKVMTVCVGNALGYGQTPNAVPYNGLLDVSVVYHPEVAQLIAGIYMFVRGKFLNHRGVHAYRTREVVIAKTRKALVSIDGRLLKTPARHLTIKVEQEVVNFIMP